jgi:hypothetical protein
LQNDSVGKGGAACALSSAEEAIGGGVSVIMGDENGFLDCTKRPSIVMKEFGEMRGEVYAEGTVSVVSSSMGVRETRLRVVEFPEADEELLAVESFSALLLLLIIWLEFVLLRYIDVTKAGV